MSPNSETPTVSVIIPSYNRAAFVTRAIDSVLAQTYGDFEIIVVDSSTDDTPKALEPYEGQIRYLYQKRAGISAARNYGIREARGVWIALLDSDDEWLPERLAAAMKAVTDRPDLVAHFSNLSLYVPGKDPVDLFELRRLPWRQREYTILDKPLLDEAKYQFGFSSSYFGRREALLQAGLFDEKLTLHEDFDLFLRLAQSGPWGVSSAKLVRLIRRQEAPEVNLSRQHRDRPLYSHECLVRIFDRLASEPRLSSAERGAVRERLGRARFDLGLAQLQERQEAEGLANVGQSFRDNPSLKSFAKFALVRLAGRRGIALIEKRRSLATGFRRSDF
jgi:glycosyltransferase involved in cell wall biosynthesis